MGEGEYISLRAAIKSQNSLADCPSWLNMRLGETTKHLCARRACLLLFPSIYDLFSSIYGLYKSFQSLSLCVELCFPQALKTNPTLSLETMSVVHGGIVGELRCREAVGTGEVPAGGTLG